VTSPDNGQSGGHTVAGLVLGVDGGNSKTEAVLVDASGALRGASRTGSSSPHRLGLDGAIDVLDGLIDELFASAGLSRHAGSGPTLAQASYLLAGIDTDQDEREAFRAIEAKGWSAGLNVANDTLAVLRAGATSAWGIAVVCGAGLNALAVAPDGRRAGYQALGEISGDWGGGEEIGRAALGAAIRASDLRGPETVLRTEVPDALGFGSPQAVADAIFTRALDPHAVLELPRVVLAASDNGDQVARGIVDRVADEVAGMATALARRLDLEGLAVEVTLGGGVLQSGNRRLIDGVVERIQRIVPRARVVLLSAPPVLGAVLDAMLTLGSPPEALDRARAQITDLRLLPTSASGE
jgi:N-acetylglucosamine kinase-like BadF-type ATPase